MFSISHYLDSTLSGIVARYFVQNGLYNRHDKKFVSAQKILYALSSSLGTVLLLDSYLVLASCLFSPYLAVLHSPVFVPHGVKIAHTWHVAGSHLRIFWFLEGWGWWGVCPRMEYQECTGLLGGCLSNSQPLRSARWVFGWIQHFSWHPLNPCARQSQVLSLLTRRS